MGLISKLFGKKKETKEEKISCYKDSINGFLEEMDTKLGFDYYPDTELVDIAGNLFSNIIFKHYPRFENDMNNYEGTKSAEKQEKINSHVYNLANALTKYLNLYSENPEISELHYGIADKSLPSFNPDAESIQDQNRLTGATKSYVYEDKLVNGCIDFRIEDIENYSLSDAVDMIEDYVKEFVEFTETEEAEDVLRTYKQFKGIREFRKNQCKEVLDTYSNMVKINPNKINSGSKAEIINHLEKVVGSFERKKKELGELGVNKMNVLSKDVSKAVETLGDIIITKEFPQERDRETSRTKVTKKYNTDKYKKNKKDTSVFWNDSKLLVDKRNKEKE